MNSKSSEDPIRTGNLDKEERQDEKGTDVMNFDCTGKMEVEVVNAATDVEEVCGTNTAMDVAIENSSDFPVNVEERQSELLTSSLDLDAGEERKAKAASDAEEVCDTNPAMDVAIENSSDFRVSVEERQSELLTSSLDLDAGEERKANAASDAEEVCDTNSAMDVAHEKSSDFPVSVEDRPSKLLSSSLDLDAGEESKSNAANITSHEEEVVNTESAKDGFVENSPNILVTSDVLRNESLSSEISEENHELRNKTQDCDANMDVCVLSKIYLKSRLESKSPTRNEVPVDMEGDNCRIDTVFDSPEKNSAGEQSIFQSTPLKPMETHVARTSDSPVDAPVACLPDSVNKTPVALTPDSPNKTSVALTSDSPNKTPVALTPDSPSDCPVEFKISDDEGDDDIVELVTGTELTFKGSHRGMVVPYSDTDGSDSSSSSDSESDSDSDNETASDSSSSDSEEKPKTRKTGDKSSSDSQAVKVHGELDIEDLPPIQDLQISVRNDQAEEIGKVLHTVDTLVVVECYKDQPPLDIDSVLFLDRGARPLGRIFDVMGPVTEPLYCVRFNSKEHILEHNVQPGMLVYSAPQTEYCRFVFLQHLMMMRGSDASWKSDKEVPGSELDFSDDEVEASNMKKLNRSMESSEKSGDEPKRKVFKLNKNGPPGTFQSNDPGLQGCTRGRTQNNFRPRNPWGWSGARFNVPNNQHSPSNHLNQFSGRAFVRPPSLNMESSSQTRAPHRLVGNNQYRQYGEAQFAQESAPGIYSELPPSASTSYSDHSSEYSSYQHQGNDYSHGNTYSDGNEYFHGNNYLHGSESYPPHNTPDQRYQAFQSEISKLINAYNNGVESPMSVNSSTFGMRPTGPSGPPPPSQFAARFAVPPPRFGSRPAVPPHFSSRPAGIPPQFGMRLGGPPPSQFGSRFASPPPQFGLRPNGPPLQFGARLPGNSYGNPY